MLQEVLRKCDVGDVNSTKSLYEPLEGFPLQTLEEFVEMESDDKKIERKKLVSIFHYASKTQFKTKYSLNYIV